MTEQVDDSTSEDFEADAIDGQAPPTTSYFKMAIAVGVVAAIVLALITML